MVICLEQGADLHMSQLMQLPLTIFLKIQIGFTFLVPAHPTFKRVDIYTRESLVAPMVGCCMPL